MEARELQLKLTHSYLLSLGGALNHIPITILCSEKAEVTRLTPCFLWHFLTSTEKSSYTAPFLDHVPNGEKGLIWFRTLSGISPFEEGKAGTQAVSDITSTGKGERE